MGHLTGNPCKYNPQLDLCLGLQTHFIHKCFFFKMYLLYYVTYMHMGSFELGQCFDFSTLYTTLSYNLIKQKFIYLIIWSFNKSGCEYICSNIFKSFFSNKKHKTTLIGLLLICLQHSKTC